MRSCTPPTLARSADQAPATSPPGRSRSSGVRGRNPAPRRRTGSASRSHASGVSTPSATTRMPSRRAEIDGRVHDRLVARVVGHAGDERPVDLQLVHAQMLQVRQRDVPRSEVVQRRRHADRPQLPQHLQRSVWIGHDRVLGDLEPQARSRKSALLEHPRHVRGQARGPADRPARGSRPRRDRTPRAAGPRSPASPDRARTPSTIARAPSDPPAAGTRPASAGRAADAPSAPAPPRHAPHPSRSPPSAGSAGPVARPRALHAARPAAPGAAVSDGRARAGRPRARCASASPRTSPRRPAAAARSRPRACDGEQRDADRAVDVHADLADRERALQSAAAAAARRPTPTPRRPATTPPRTRPRPAAPSVSPGCSASSSRGPICVSTSSPA